MALETVSIKDSFISKTYTQKIGVDENSLLGGFLARYFPCEPLECFGMYGLTYTAYYLKFKPRIVILAERRSSIKVIDIKELEGGYLLERIEKKINHFYSWRLCNRQRSNKTKSYFDIEMKAVELLYWIFDEVEYSWRTSSLYNKYYKGA